MIPPLAASITKSASRQTFYTIRFLVDRERVDDAYRAYAYFRWVDDCLDAGTGSRSERNVFLARQQRLLENCYRGEPDRDVGPEEQMLVDLVQHDPDPRGGLHSYLHNMMDVMAFDAARRGQTITQTELSEYSCKLAVAVTEAIYYFIGHDDPSPRHEARYLAVTAAHITHMLRDAREDADAGYYNIPGEYLAQRRISPRDVNSDAYREWVCGRVQLAYGYFSAARECTAQVRNWRCRLAGFAYTARFEWMLEAIERDNCCLRCEYPERKSLRAGLWMLRSAITALFAQPASKLTLHKLTTQPMRVEKR